MNTTRRHFLKAAGATLALPWLDSLNGFVHAAESNTSPQRLLMICLPLGIHRQAIIPTDSGPKYQSTECNAFHALSRHGQDPNNVAQHMQTSLSTDTASRCRRGVGTALAGCDDASVCIGVGSAAANAICLGLHSQWSCSGGVASTDGGYGLGTHTVTYAGRLAD